MITNAIEEIKKQGKSFAKFTNKWNVMQQLIDIVSVQPDCAEIVYQDLQIKEMNLSCLANKIIGQRLADPFKVMQEICKFYAIACPKELPPEVWRNKTSATTAETVSKPSEPLSLLDLM